jgi:hypothetical protein
MRLRIKDERDRVINEWKYRRKQAIDDLIVYGVLGVTVVLLLTFIGCVLWYRHTEIEPYEKTTEIV